MLIYGCPWSGGMSDIKYMKKSALKRKSYKHACDTIRVPESGIIDNWIINRNRRTTLLDEITLCLVKQRTLASSDQRQFSDAALRFDLPPSAIKTNTAANTTNTRHITRHSKHNSCKLLLFNIGHTTPHPRIIDAVRGIFAKLGVAWKPKKTEFGHSTIVAALR